MTSEINIILLADRGVVSVEGAQARPFLQGLVTNDIGKLDRDAAIHAGLLSPQGKILFDFFIVKSADGVLLDVARDRAGDLVKRLTLYKLRAAVTIQDVSDRFRVYAVFGSGPMPGGDILNEGITYSDPRLAALGWRAIVAADRSIAADANIDAYDAHRIALGVPEGGRDYAFGDAFPHEALFDQLNGVSFSKGCYVGQEVVSRMEHRGTARKRVVYVETLDGTALHGDEPVQAGDVEIGRVGSVSGSRGLALIRLDRVEEFAAKGIEATAGGAALGIKIPPRAQFKPTVPHS
ncbi:MAG: YgfZ/GcvT domain-containing protein [Deltaproteobacteria bacterium]